MDVKKIRESLGETQEEFARRIGVDQGTISRWETAGVPSTGAARAAVLAVAKSLEEK